MRVRWILGLSVAVGFLVQPSRASAASFADILSPNVYTVPAGGSFTLKGFFIFSDSAIFQYGEQHISNCQGCVDESLFGLSPTSPHLGILTGTIVGSRDFNPPVGTAYFEDDFLGPAGFLGPLTQIGPATTPVTDWRTFVVPVGTLPGVYFYSYGINWTENGGLASGLYASNLQVNVTAAVPEPASLILTGLGFAFIGIVGGLKRVNLNEGRSKCRQQNEEAASIKLQ